MDIFIGILTAVEVIVCLLLILVVLMQRPRQEGLGASFGDAAASQVWGAQTTNVLQKFTVYLAIILFGITILLAVLVSRKQNAAKGPKLFGDAKPEAVAPAPATSPDEELKAKLMKQIQEAASKENAAKAGDPAKPAEAPKADDKKAAPAPATTPAPSPTPAPASAPTPAPTPAPAPAAAPAPTPEPAPAAAPTPTPAPTPAPAPAPAPPADQPK
ncbi:preprotein translocase subunit SecG [Prosthecobacter sp.]|uniref:preprotein translocase subunit SecG n=1 Tax=Prosthecobacter sp. TaxID=1965333 RepID=UPI003784B090